MPAQSGGVHSGFVAAYRPERLPAQLAYRCRVRPSAGGKWRADQTPDPQLPAAVHEVVDRRRGMAGMGLDRHADAEVPVQLLCAIAEHAR